MQEKKSYDVIIVGAGASGMIAAISAARRGARTAILEHMEQAGKKILSTGNGKCNFTNKMQGVEYYRGQNPAFVLPVLERFGVEETLSFFREIGIIAKEKRGGYYYPASEQASAIRQALLLEIERLGIHCYYEIGIRSIQKKVDTFCFNTKQGEYRSRTCIIATGGKAAKKTGSDGSGIPYVEGFGHELSEFIPALVQMQAKQSFLKEIAGIRAEATLTLCVENTKKISERGEVQLTEFGVSGIPAFQLSRYAGYALKEQKKVHVLIDFAPELDEETLRQYLKEQRLRWPETSINNVLFGFLNQKLIPVLRKEAELLQVRSLGKMTNRQMEQLIFQIKNFRIDIIGTKNFDSAQVCAGGVDTSQIENTTMESKLVKGLYFAGEIVDIDGMCGGYNLQWAWSSGWVAGYHGGNV